jgi:hypothetical protein
MKQNEGKIQAACFRWLGYAYPKLGNRIYAIPNGGKRSASEANAFKAQGVLAGVWDIFLSMPDSSKMWHGAYIEMKDPSRRNHKNGGLTDNQIEFKKANENDYFMIVIYSFEEFKIFIESWTNKAPQQLSDKPVTFEEI